VILSLFQKLKFEEKKMSAAEIDEIIKEYEQNYNNNNNQSAVASSAAMIQLQKELDEERQKNAALSSQLQQEKQKSADLEKQVQQLKHQQIGARAE
jgi:hypothetical protein